MQGVKRLTLVRRQRARNVIDHAERPQGVSFTRQQRRAGVEPDERTAGDQRIIAKTLVLARVMDDEQSALLYRVGAERDRTRGLCAPDSLASLKPLPVRADEADERDGRSTDLRSEQGEVVEGLFRFGIEDAVVSQRRQSGGLIVWDGSDVHIFALRGKARVFTR